jgi:hypothetical protein
MGNGAGIGPAFAVSFIVRAITSTEVRSPAELATLDTMLDNDWTHHHYNMSGCVVRGLLALAQREARNKSI